MEPVVDQPLRHIARAHALRGLVAAVVTLFKILDRHPDREMFPRNHWRSLLPAALTFPAFAWIAEGWNGTEARAGLFGSTPGRPGRSAFSINRSFPWGAFAAGASWLNELDYDAWDEQMVKDFSPGGRGMGLVEKVRREIAAAKTIPIEEGLRGPERTGSRLATDL